MRANEFTTEARRNPEQNPRQVSGHKGAVDFLVNSSVDINQIGISMTSINKIGVNPRSTYNTPNGVYFYPGEYYLDRKDQNVPRKLPFVDDAPYIQIFQFPEPILFLDDYTNANYRRDLEKLKTALDNIPGLLDKFKRKVGGSMFSTDTKDFTAFIEYLDQSKLTEGRVSSPGGNIWFVTWKLSQWLRDVIGSKAANIWNWILRTVLGYNTVLDFGDGIIYPDEPTQGVVLNTSGIRLLKSFENSTPISDIRRYLRYDSFQTVIDRYKNKQISIHDLRKYVIEHKNIHNILRYLTDIEPGWKYGRNMLLNELPRISVVTYSADFRDLIDVLSKRGERWPELEPYLTKSIPIACYYALKILKQRWPEIEPNIDEIVSNWNFVSDISYKIIMNYIFTFGVKLSSDAEDSIAVFSKQNNTQIDGNSIDVLYARDVLKDPDPTTWRRRHIKAAAEIDGKQ